MSAVNWFVETDKDLTERLAVCSRPDSATRPVMRLLEYSCHGVLWLASVGAAILVSHQIELHEKLLNLMCALLFDIAVIGLCKVIFRRQRPSQNHGDMMTILMDKYSFPSGHASRAVMVTCFMVTHFALTGVHQVLLIVWSVSVCLSRILLGRHHVSDVIFGAVLGIVEHQIVNSWLWLPRNLCESLIRPIQEEMHL